MPRFIVALPLSVLTFWRYLVMTPLLAVAAVLCTVLAFVPVLGLILPGACAAGMTLIGLRCALVARGHAGTILFPGLPTLALICSVIVILGGMVAGLAEYAIVESLRIAGFAVNEPALKAEFLQLSPTAGAVLFLLILPKLMLSSVLTVPMTAAAAQGGGARGMLFGLGQGMLGLCVPLLVWFLLLGVLVGFGDLGRVLRIGIESIRSGRLDGALLGYGHTLTIFVALLWASSWFFTTAVLYWEKAEERQARRKPAATPRTSAEDLRAWREAMAQRSARQE